MRSSTLILLKPQFLVQSGINTLRYEKDKSKKNKMIFYDVSILLVVIMLGVYCFGIGYGLGSIGLAGIIPVYAFTVTSLIILLFTMFKASGTLFAFKDYDMLMALPVKTTTIITSRFLLMYVLNALFSLIIMIPMGICYSLWAHPQMLFYVMWFIIIFITPLVPMTIAAVLGSVISAISSGFKYTNLINIILSFTLLIALMGVMVNAGAMGSRLENVEKLAALGTVLSRQMYRIYPLSVLLERAVCQYNIPAFLAFLAISAVWYYIFVKAVSLKYKAINTALTTHRTKSNYKLQSLKTASPFIALYSKEMKRFFSSYIYVLNIGSGAVLLLVGSIACFILGLDRIEHLVGISDIKAVVSQFVPFVISAMLAMTCTTSVSLSLEGKNLWILQSIPVKAATIYRSKMAVNLTILLPVALLSSLLVSLSIKPDIIAALRIFLTPLAYVCFTPVWGMYINQKLPNFTWESEVAVVKQSMAAMLGMLGGMVFGMIPVLILAILPGINGDLITGVITLGVVGFSAFLYKKVCGTKLPGN